MRVEMMVDAPVGQGAARLPALDQEMERLVSGCRNDRIGDDGSAREMDGTRAGRAVLSSHPEIIAGIGPEFAASDRAVAGVKALDNCRTNWLPTVTAGQTFCTTARGTS